MNHRPLIFIDLETTGASTRDSRVLEIGAIRVENLQVVDSYSTLLRVPRPIPPFITNLTGIDDSMTKDAPSFADIADTLRDFMYGGIFVAHNVGFDYSFMQLEYRSLGQKFSMDKLCTVRLSRAFYPEQRRHNLDTIISTHGFVVNSRHRALDDAQVLVDFFNKIIANHDLQTFAKMDKLIRYAR
jgi:DNA polymerase-3 subunit epsilon